MKCNAKYCAKTVYFLDCIIKFCYSIQCSHKMIHDFGTESILMSECKKVSVFVHSCSNILGLL